jgi:Tfp pilus assembly protein PilN
MSQQINLLNTLLLKKRDSLSANNLLLVTMSVILLIVLVSAGVFLRTTQFKKTEDELAQQLSVLESQAAVLRASVSASAKDPKLEQEASAIEIEIQNREKIVGILSNSNFGNTKGYSAYLTAFARQIPNGVWLTGFSLDGAGNEISIQGRSLQGELVPLYVSQLKNEKIMQGKTFSALHMQRPQLVNVNAAGATGIAADAKKANEDAPYLEFDLHSTEVKEKAMTEGKVQ